jgi:hypothetical protein
MAGGRSRIPGNSSASQRRPARQMSDPGELGAALLRAGAPCDEPRGDRGRPAAERRPRPADVDLTSDERRPGRADLRGERRIALGRAREVVGARLARRAVTAAFDRSAHAACCSGGTVAALRSRPPGACSCRLTAVSHDPPAGAGAEAFPTAARYAFAVGRNRAKNCAASSSRSSGNASTAAPPVASKAPIHSAA